MKRRKPKPVTLERVLDVIDKSHEQLVELITDTGPPYSFDQARNQIETIRQEQNACFQTLAQILARLDRIMPVTDAPYVLLKTVTKPRKRPIKVTPS